MPKKSIGFTALYRASVVVVTCVRLYAQQQTEGAPADAESVRAKSIDYAALNRQVKQVHGDAASGLRYHPEPGDSITARLRGIVEGEVISHLDVSPNSEQAVRNAVTEIQAFRPDADPTTITNAPFVRVYDLTGARQAAVAYILDEGREFLPDVQPYLEFYDKLDGDWRLRATAPTMEEFRAGTFFVRQIKTATTGESWWIAWGVKFGDTASRLKARLYAFDGNGVSTIWKRDGLIRGDISVDGDSVALDYDPKYSSAKPMARIHEVYRATPNGFLQVQ